jgi:ABC-type polysaccharide/polyol phosphate export permease
MYATPIFYPVSALPEKVAFLLQFNPMYHYVTFFRDVVLNGAVPSATIWVGSFGFSALAIGAGLLIFRKLQRNFILYV